MLNEKGSGAVDIVVTIASTVGLEGALPGKPIVTLDIYLFALDTFFANRFVERHFKLNDLEKGIHDIIDGQ